MDAVALDLGQHGASPVPPRERPASAPRRPVGNTRQARPDAVTAQRPQSARSAATSQRPLSARLDAEHVQPPANGSRMATALAAAARGINPKLPMELRYPEAALMALAPGTRLLPCKSSTCCWRWAASQLIDECQVASGNAVYYRNVLEEELGDSAVQKFLDLETEHAALLEKHNMLGQQLEAKTATSRSLQEDNTQLRDMLFKAQESEQMAREEQAAAEANCSRLESQIRELERNTQAEAHQDLQERLSAAEKKLAEQDDKESELRQELKQALGEKLDMTIKLKSLQALEAKLAKQRLKRNREKKPPKPKLF